MKYEIAIKFEEGFTLEGKKNQKNDDSQKTLCRHHR